MKYFLALLLVSNVAFAQYNDGFHSIEKDTCSSGDCIIIEDSIYEMITYEDIDGYEFSRLNKKADIESVFHGKTNACFTGDYKKVENILSAMKGVNEFYYVDGGHMIVTSLSVLEESNDFVVFKFSYKTDYTGDEEFSRAYVINNCSKPE